MSAAVTAARRAQDQGYDIFVTPENNARNLWGKLNAPIVAIPLTAFDSAQALHCARRDYGEPVALFEFRYRCPHLAALQLVLNCEIKEFVFHDDKDVLPKLRRAMQEGCRAVVGGAVIERLAREVGIPCVPRLPKPDDIMMAFHQAEQIASVRRIEEREAMKFKYVVQYSFTGVIVANEENKISVLNQAAEKIFGITADEAVGRTLDEVIPRFNPIQGRTRSWHR